MKIRLMGLYVGTSELKSAYVGTTPVKEIYVGTTKVRPSGWQPGANTVAYYPLTSTATVNDESGNGYNMTNNGIVFNTYDGVDCGYFNHSSYAYKSGSLFTGNPTFTVSIWEKLSNTSYGGINMRGFGRSSSNYGFGIWIRNGSEVYTGVRKNDRNTGATVDTGWHHVVFAYSGGSGTVYLDGTAVYNGTWTPNIQNNNTAIGANATLGDGWSGYLSNAIFEDKAWTAQEIADYYNSTKSDYGL